MVAELVKTIKPKRLAVDKVRLNILNTLRAEGNDIAKEYRKTVKTWKDKPKFEVLIGLTNKDATVVVGPTGDADAVNHFVWTDEGTEPHIIQAKDGGRLFFGTTGGKAKTTPGIIGSNPGVIAGKPYTRPQSVNHPGTKARRLTETIMSRTRRQRIIKRLIEASKVETK